MKLPVPDAAGVFLEAQEYVAVEEVAGKGAVLEPAAGGGGLGAEAVNVVHALQEVRGPGQLVLHRAYLEVGIALEDAAKYQVGQGHAHPVFDIAQEGRPGGVEVGELLPRPRAIGALVHAQGHPQVLGRGPQGLVLRLIVGAALGRVHGDHGPDKAHLGAAFQFL